MKKFALSLMLLLGSGLCILSADPGNGKAYGKDHGSGNPHNGVPEISAGAAISGLTLLSGILLMARRRRAQR